jgi:hypothetical protein
MRWNDRMLFRLQSGMKTGKELSYSLTYLLYFTLLYITPLSKELLKKLRIVLLVTHVPDFHGLQTLVTCSAR